MIKVQTLKSYIDKDHAGQVYKAAEVLGVTPATIYANLKGTAFVYGHELYRKTKKVKK